MTVLPPLSSLIAPCTILCDIVLVKKIIKSGLPIFLRRPPLGLVKILL